MRNKLPLHGVNAHYTPAYVISLGVYGSNLTTPVIASLPPGYYFFGADDPSGNVIVDYKRRIDVPSNLKGTIYV